jgi:hypothetical protein
MPRVPPAGSRFPRPLVMLWQLCSFISCVYVLRSTAIISHSYIVSCYPFPNPFSGDHLQSALYLSRDSKHHWRSDAKRQYLTSAQQRLIGESTPFGRKMPFIKNVPLCHAPCLWRTMPLLSSHFGSRVAVTAGGTTLCTYLLNAETREVPSSQRPPPPHFLQKSPMVPLTLCPFGSHSKYLPVKSRQISDCCHEAVSQEHVCASLSANNCRKPCNILRWKC